MLGLDRCLLGGMPHEMQGVVRQRDVPQYFERHRQGRKDVVDSVFSFGEGCELLARRAEGYPIDGLAFGESELFEDEGVVEGGDAVELEGAVLPGHC